jgi:RNA polymerase sigma factor (sigma-70 family)
MIEKFFRDEYNTLVKRVKARRMQEADAEDVVQEAFARAIKYKDSFDPEQQELGAWFNTILNNVFKSYRHANFTGDFSFTEEVMEEVDDADKNWSDVNLLNKVKEEIGKRSNEHSCVLHLNLIKGYKRKEVAQILDEKEENIKKIVYRFKKEMREKYRELLEE